MNDNDNHCGTCRHWHRQPGNPAALGQVRGACMRFPPAQTEIVTGPGQVVKIAGYPLLPPEFLACGEYHPQLEFATTEDDES